MGFMSDVRDTVPVEVRALVLDPTTNLPIVILHDEAGDRYLPIWIGLFEAQAIATSMEGIDPPRPMTHDLFHTALADFGARVTRIVIRDLQESTFYATVTIESAGDSSRTLDSRPSDAIALAVRSGADVHVAEAVFEKALTGTLHEKIGGEDQIRKWLEDADPEEFGKYKM